MDVPELKTLINDQGFIRKVQYTLITLFVIVIILDTYLALDSVDDNTISKVIQTNTDDGLFILTYFWGAVAANLFFIRFRKPVVNGIIGSIIIVGIALLFAILNVETRLTRFMASQDYNFSVYSMSMIFGVVMGLIFWRQQEDKIHV